MGLNVASITFTSITTHTSTVTVESITPITSTPIFKITPLQGTYSQSITTASIKPSATSVKIISLTPHSTTPRFNLPKFTTNIPAAKSEGVIFTKRGTLTLPTTSTVRSTTKTTGTTFRWPDWFPFSTTAKPLSKTFGSTVTRGVVTTVKTTQIMLTTDGLSLTSPVVISGNFDIKRCDKKLFYLLHMNFIDLIGIIIIFIEQKPITTVRFNITEDDSQTNDVMFHQVELLLAGGSVILLLLAAIVFG
jgi:hypothetical protein